MVLEDGRSAGTARVAAALAGCLLVLVAAIGCQQEPSQKKTPTPLDLSTTGTISGTILFQGPVPAQTELNLASSGECRALHSGTVYAGDVLVQDGKLANVIVYVKEGLGDRVFAAPTEPVDLDQRGCLFVPRVAAAQTGQPIRFLNGDALQHNVHGKPSASRGWNFSLSFKGASRNVTIDEPAPVIPVTCDIHPWMQAFVGVFDHPYFAVTGADGRFVLKNVPPGEYVLEAWHERFGTRSAKVSLAAKATAETTLTFSAGGGTS